MLKESGRVEFSPTRLWNPSSCRHPQCSGIGVRLEVNLVILPVEELRALIADTKQELQRRSLPTRAPYRFTRNGVPSEIGLVLASEVLPDAINGQAALFTATTRAEAIRLLRHRALLVVKRGATATGTRIMWGSAVIHPWARVLQRHGRGAHCLTSRSLATCARMLSKAAQFVRPR